MNRTNMLALAALGLAASGLAFNLRPVASQAPAPPAAQSERECLSQLVHVGEAIGQLHDRRLYLETPFDERSEFRVGMMTLRRYDGEWPWTPVSHGAQQEIEAVALARDGERCEDRLPKVRADLRRLHADVTALEKADVAAWEKHRTEKAKIGVLVPPRRDKK